MTDPHRSPEPRRKPDWLLIVPFGVIGVGMLCLLFASFLA